VALAFFLAALLFPGFSVLAGGLTVHDGGTVTVNGPTVDLNCQDLTVESGGTFEFTSGTVTRCGNLVVQAGGSLIPGTGIINYCEATLPPTAATQGATDIGTASATLNGLVNPNGGGTTVAFQYGLTTAYGAMAEADQSPVNGSTDTAVSAGVTGLDTGATYHFRVVAQNALGTTYGADLTFSTPAHLPPAAVTLPPTTVETTSATLNGTVNAEGTSTTVNFQYGLTDAYGTTVTADQSPVTGSTDTAVSRAISGLSTGLTYHYRVVAVNSGGTTYGGDMTFIPGTAPPTAVTDGASGIAATTATLNGVVNASGASTTVTFEYGPTSDYGETAIAVPGTVTGFTNTAVSASLSALNPNTTYHFRVVAVNAGGVSSGSDRTFTTQAAPAVATNTASGLSPSGATLNGTVNANGTSTAVTFEYGTDTTYGTTVTADQSPVTGSADTAVSKAVTGLSAGTVYHYRAVGQNVHGTTYGGDRTFFTSAPAAPTAATQAATMVIADGAVLNGTVNSQNATTTVTFEYGLDTGYGQIAPADQSPLSGTTDTPVSASLGELLPDTTYHFRVRAENTSGTSFGGDMTFHTLPLPPAPVTWPASAIGAGSATLNGRVDPRGTATTVTFEYGTDTTYGTTVDALQSPLTTNLGNAQNVSAGLSGLANDTTYHFRVVASNDGGTVQGNDMTFTIGTVGTAPTATTVAATGVGSLAATLNGTINPGDAETAVLFEYGLDTGYGSTVTASPSPVSGSTDTPVAAALGELLPDTTYHYRVMATNANGTTYGADMTFTTAILSQAPEAVTHGASSVGTTTATLNGAVNAHGLTTTVTFEYGPTTGYGTAVTAVQSPVTDSTDTLVNRTISGLADGVTYHFRVVAENASGTTYGEDRTFTPGIAPPTATTHGASGVGATAATMNGAVNANGSGATVAFQYGPSRSYSRTVDAIPATVAGSSDTDVSAAVSGLLPDMTYHYRVTAVNPGGTACGADMTFTTGTGPAVTTEPPSGVGIATATLNGIVNANDESTAVTFEYGLTNAYGHTVTATPGTVTGSTDTPVSATLAGLTPSTTYHFRAAGQNTGGTTRGVDMAFTTGAIDPRAPIAVTEPAVNPTGTGATLVGTVQSNNISTTVTFEYGPDTSYGTTVAAEPSPVQSEFTSYHSKTITGLTAGNTYHYRVVATNAYGTGYGGDMTFVAAPPAPPTVTTEAATAVGVASATLNGTVNANNGLASVYFQYGLSDSYGSQVPANPSAVAGTTDTPVSTALSGLAEDTTYHYRVLVLSSFGFTYGSDMTFTTGLANPPSASTGGATVVGSDGATVNGTVNSNGGSTTVIFEYGKTTEYGRSVPADQSPVTGTGDIPVTGSLTLLEPNMLYHYRVTAQKDPDAVLGSLALLAPSMLYQYGITAQNNPDTVYGEDMTFTTLGAPPVAVTGAATAVTPSGATMNGTVNANNGSTTVTFNYGLTAAYGSTATAAQSPVTGLVDTAVSATLSGLAADTVYHYQVVAQNASGITEGADMTFFTGILPPAVTTGEATGIGTDSATLQGTVNARNGSAAVVFEFGETTGYGRTVTAEPSPVTGSADTAVMAGIDMLDADTLYHYRVCAENSAGTTCGVDRTFTTDPAGLPVVTTAPVTAIAAVTATGGGNVTSSGFYPMTARGVCWATSHHPTTSNFATSNGTVPGVFTSSLTGLNPNTTYYVRAYATNTAGTAYGGEVSFTTTAEVAPGAIPTLSEWGLIVFALLMAGMGVAILRKRKPMAP